MVPRRGRAWLWAGRVTFGVIIAGLVAHLVLVGLDKADRVASAISVVVALVALAAPYLLPARGPGGVSMPDRSPAPARAVTSLPDPPAAATVTDSGAATASRAGVANTGVIHGDVRPEFHEHRHCPPTTVTWPVQVGQPPALASAFQPRRGHPHRGECSTIDCGCWATNTRAPWQRLMCCGPGGTSLSSILRVTGGHLNEPDACESSR